MSALQPTDIGSQTILIVENNLTDSKLLRAPLAGSEYIIRAVNTAEHALESLKTEQPALMLIDLDLPVMDGIALAGQLKQAAATARIPMIAISAYTEGFSRKAVMDAGFAAYLVKPIDTRMLLANVAAVLKGN